VQRLVVVERKSSNNPAADTERVDIAVLTGNRRWNGGHVPLGALDDG
jgi:hypothetical protein